MKRFRWIGAAVAVVLLVALWFLRSGVLRREFAGPSVRARIATTRDELGGLILIADAEGLFRESGLAVELHDQHEVGVQAVAALLAGEADFACATDFVAVRTLQHAPELRILASIAGADVYRVVGNKARGILTPSDLEGKRIGLHRGTIADFFLSRFLLFSGIEEAGVSPVNVRTAESARALLAGKVDAVLTFERYAEEAADALGPSAAVFPAQQGQDFYWLLLTTGAVLRGSPEAAVRVLKALTLAEDALQEDRSRGSGIIRDRLNARKAHPELYTYRVELGQPLLIAMEAEAKWLNEESGAEAAIPNYLTFIRSDILDAVKREADTLVR